MDLGQGSPMVHHFVDNDIELRFLHVRGPIETIQQMKLIGRKNLRLSDIGISMMRQRFFEELEGIAAGRDPKGIIRNPNMAQAIELPNMARELNTEGIPLADFQKDPLLRQRLQEFRHHFGQPPEVRRAFVEAMGI